MVYLSLRYSNRRSPERDQRNPSGTPPFRENQPDRQQAGPFGSGLTDEKGTSHRLPWSVRFAPVSWLNSQVVVNLLSPLSCSSESPFALRGAHPMPPYPVARGNRDPDRTSARVVYGHTTGAPAPQPPGVGTRSQAVPRTLRTTKTLALALAACSVFSPSYACQAQRGDPMVGGRSILTWRSLLRDGSRLAQLESFQALALIGPSAEDALPELLFAAGNNDRAVRVAAIGAIGEIGPKAASAAPDLAKMLIGSSGDSVVSQQLERALAKIGEAAVPELLKLLENLSREIRLLGIDAIGRTGSAAASAVPR